MCLVEWTLQEILGTVSGDCGDLCLCSIEERIFIGSRLITHYHLDDWLITRQTRYNGIDPVTARGNNSRFLVIEKDLNPADICSEVFAIQQDLAFRSPFGGMI
jgi:hypothetical protein